VSLRVASKLAKYTCFSSIRSAGSRPAKDPPWEEASRLTEASLHNAPGPMHLQSTKESMTNGALS
jgi:hypothetical protein